MLDSEPDPAYDAIAHQAATICDTPIALVSVSDTTRRWFKANVGLAEVSEVPREIAFCAYAIESTEFFEVPDALLDTRFADNPLVAGETNLRYYAGMPLVDRDGTILGTLCTLDHRPRRLADEQREALARLARSVLELIEKRKSA